MGAVGVRRGRRGPRAPRGVVRPAAVEAVLRALGRAPARRRLRGAAAVALVEESGEGLARDYVPFELFRSEFGQNSWNAKKTTKSHLFQIAARAKPTRQKRQQTTHFTRRGCRKTEKKETGGDKRGLVAGR